MSRTKVILMLPAELIEYILIISASFGWPSAIAALSQTCKDLYDLIYHGPDQRLWREIFLTTFDDPRPALQHLKAMGVTLPGVDSESGSFSWALEYQSRIRTKLHMERNTSFPVESTLRVASDVNKPITRSMIAHATELGKLVSALKTLVSTISTSTPLCSSQAMSFVHITPSAPTSKYSAAPPFPPVALLLSSSSSARIRCRNTPWLEAVLCNGYPAELTRTLFARLSITIQDGTPPFTPGLTPASYWEGSEIAQLFYKLVCCTGFLPIPQHPITIEPGSADVLDGPADSEEESSASDGEFVPSVWSALPSNARQFVDARALARRRVYDMRYLRADRCWGPYLTVKRSASHSNAGDGLPSEASGDFTWGSEPDSEQEQEDFALVVGRIIGTDENRPIELDPPIRSDELQPDYVWLASARIVLEANMRETYRRADNEVMTVNEIVPALRRMDCLRMGAAPGYWKAWNKRADGTSSGHVDNGRGKAKESEVEGWDWAGVEGTWRRCICWLDYRELLVYNLPIRRDSFLNDSIQEVLRIIPMTVQIVGYSKPPPSPSGNNNTLQLPIIHVEGESPGSEDMYPDMTRKMKGTVSMIRDGAIRWNMVSTVPGSNESEWSSEAVQIGGPGAAGGLLGMWTGAEHESSDPLGPFWAWKVL